MSFTYPRTIRFQDTDAAGVVYFAQGLAICHEAYEASLAEAGIEPQSFFLTGDCIFPITHAKIDFYQPMRCGDRIIVSLTAQPIHESSYAVTYQIHACDRSDRCLVEAMTRHVCLQTKTGQKVLIPPNLQKWLDL